MQALALDFDGVISDSAPESFVVALRAYLEMCRDERWPVEDVAISQTLAAVSAPEGGPTLRHVRVLPVYARFLELMPLGNRAEDYAVVLSAIEADADPVDQRAYDRWRARHSSDFLAVFHGSIQRGTVKLRRLRFPELRRNVGLNGDDRLNRAVAA